MGPRLPQHPGLILSRAPLRACHPAPPSKNPLLCLGAARVSCTQGPGVGCPSAFEADPCAGEGQAVLFFNVIYFKLFSSFALELF